MCDFLLVINTYLQARGQWRRTVEAAMLQRGTSLDDDDDDEA